MRYFSFEISTVKYILENVKKFDWKATGSSLNVQIGVTFWQLGEVTDYVTPAGRKFLCAQMKVQD